MSRLGLRADRASVRVGVRRMSQKKTDESTPVCSRMYALLTLYWPLSSSLPYPVHNSPTTLCECKILLRTQSSFHSEASLYFHPYSYQHAFTTSHIPG